jgi:hypothetical protein
MQRMIEFVVEGRGSFPVDMLRYDTCWPRTESDASIIDSSFQPRNRVTHVVALKGLREPTEGRWESFGYKVREVTKASSGRWAA